jgi:hypothetical protein
MSIPTSPSSCFSSCFPCCFPKPPPVKKHLKTSKTGNEALAQQQKEKKELHQANKLPKHVLVHYKSPSTPLPRVLEESAPTRPAMDPAVNAAFMLAGQNKLSMKALQYTVSQSQKSHTKETQEEKRR